VEEGFSETSPTAIVLRGFFAEVAVCVKQETTSYYTLVAWWRNIIQYTRLTSANIVRATFWAAQVTFSAVVMSSSWSPPPKRDVLVPGLCVPAPWLAVRMELWRWQWPVPAWVAPLVGLRQTRDNIPQGRIYLNARAEEKISSPPLSLCIVLAPKWGAIK